MKFMWPAGLRRFFNPAVRREARGPAGAEFGNSASISRKRNLFRSLVFAVAAVAIPASGQDGSRGYLEPQALRLQITAASVGIRLEAASEKVTSGNSGGTISFDRVFMGPVFGLNATGSVYHPNLLNFSVSGEISPGYEIENSSIASLSKRKELRFLGNYGANFVFLSTKPYRFSLLLNQSYTFRDYDFFNRVEVNSLRYGANLGYQAGRVPFTLNVWQRSESTFGLTSSTALDETGLTFDAKNTRASGESAFNYTYTKANRSDLTAQSADSGQSVGIGDEETFGRNKQFHLNTNAGYSVRQSDFSPSNDTIASAILSVEHSPTLSSNYDVNYAGSTTDTTIGSSKSSNVNGSASLRHQLYESLTSTLRVLGEDYTTDGSFNGTNGVSTKTSSENTRFGAGVTEQYTKRLGSIGQLSIVGAMMLEHSIIASGGDMMIQTDERHVFSSGTSSGVTDAFFLNLPNVDETAIVITNDHNDFPAYQEGLDYTVSNNGSLTMIRRTATSNIPQNATVFVDYRAKATGSGEYDTVTGLLNMRIDLWRGLVAVYGRYNSVQNSGAPNILLQDMNVYAVGLETTWRWLHAGLEYESHTSTLSTYQDTRLFQSVTFKPTRSSSLSFDLNESQTQYTDAARMEQNYSFMTRFQQVLSQNCRTQLEGGVAVRQGIGVDQTLMAVRPGFEWNFGQLEMKAGYSLEYGKFLGSDQRINQLLFFSARRNF